MKLTLHTDYALRMLIFLAVREGRPATVSDVAAPAEGGAESRAAGLCQNG